MVLLHVKGTDKFNEFLFECFTRDSLDVITRNVVSIHNLRITLKVLCNEMKELIKYGPMRNINTKEKEKEKERITDLDPTERRIGIPIKNENIINLLNELITKIETYLNIERISLRLKGLTKLSELNEFLNELRGALLIAYPKQLPSYDILQEILIENNMLLIDSKQIYDMNSAQLWFTSKKLLRNNKLNKYIGNNEKTKIIVKITKEKANMPLREPVVNEETRKKMMSYWYKKQEENKELATDDDNSYLQSQWADTQALKKSFVGIDNHFQYK